MANDLDDSRNSTKWDSIHFSLGSVPCFLLVVVAWIFSFLLWRRGRGVGVHHPVYGYMGICTPGAVPYLRVTQLLQRACIAGELQDRMESDGRGEHFSSGPDWHVHWDVFPRLPRFDRRIGTSNQVQGCITW